MIHITAGKLTGELAQHKVEGKCSSSLYEKIYLRPLNQLNSTGTKAEFKYSTFKLLANR
jgi:hypothetical protein